MALTIGMGCEMTLFHVLELALAKLGGTLERERDLSAHDKILTPAELQARFRANRNSHLKASPLYALYGLLMLVIIPCQVLWLIVSMPFQLASMLWKNPHLLRKPKR